MRTILVTGVGGASGLYTAKILRESGYRVIGTDCNEHAAGKCVVDKFFLVPPAKPHSGALLNVLINLCMEEYVDASLPNVDEELLLFARYNPTLKAIVSSTHTVGICLNKYSLYRALSKHVLMPQTCLLSRFYEIEYDSYVIKPMVGRGSRNITFADGSGIEVAARALSKLNCVDEYIVQERILDGEEYTVDILYNSKNKPVVIAPRKRLITYGGVSAVGQSVKCWDDLKKAIDFINRELRFFGPVNMQFIVNENGLYLIEINPRLSGGIGITYANGVNIPDMAVKMFFDETFTIPELKEDVVYRILEDRKCTS